jgi:hypothetical protein
VKVKNRETAQERVIARRDLQYPADDLAYAAERLGVFENPDIEKYYYDCLISDFDDEIAYQQGLLTIVHTFDVDHTHMEVPRLKNPKDVNSVPWPRANSEEETVANRDLHGLGLLLADIHFNTAHFTECLCELLTIKRRLMNEGASDNELIKYITAAIHDVAPLAKPFTEHPVISSSLLAVNFELTDNQDP